MDKIKEVLSRKMIINEPLQELYLKEIEKHSLTEITTRKHKFLIEIKDGKAIIRMDGVEFIQPVKRTFKTKDLKKFTGLFSEDFNIKFF